MIPYCPFLNDKIEIIRYQGKKRSFNEQEFLNKKFEKDMDEGIRMVLMNEGIRMVLIFDHIVSSDLAFTNNKLAESFLLLQVFISIILSFKVQITLES